MLNNNLKTFREKTTSYIQQNKKKSIPLEMMYYRSEEEVDVDINSDILDEQVHSPLKGIIYKFPRRILIMLTYTCLANCRYCERQGRVGVDKDDDNKLNNNEIDEIIQFVTDNQDIDEIIVSGGDPLTHLSGLDYLTNKLSKLGHIKILRIKTRVPVQDPSRVNYELLKEIVDRFDVVYLALHIDHPDELTVESEASIKKIRALGYILLGQSIFLKGINNDKKVLHYLFNRMSQLGIRPYYIYHCQALPNTQKFIMEIDEEREIMTYLREQISGIAYPMHVIDMQHTIGKVILPTMHWNVDMAITKDYLGNKYDLQINQPIILDGVT